MLTPISGSLLEASVIVPVNLFCANIKEDVNPIKIIRIFFSILGYFDSLKIV